MVEQELSSYTKKKGCFVKEGRMFRRSQFGLYRLTASQKGRRMTLPRQQAQTEETWNDATKAISNESEADATKGRIKA